MNFGMMMKFENPQKWFQPASELYRRYLDDIVLSEELGYDSVWLPGHHFDDGGLAEAGDLAGDRVAVPSVESLRDLVPADLPFGSPVVGTPDDVALAIEKLRNESRTTHLCLTCTSPVCRRRSSASR